jgi:hypothetical protein
MAAANARVAAVAALFEETSLIESVPLFKEDRPRRIDRVISFFGEDTDGRDAWTSPAEPWAQR